MNGILKIGKFVLKMYAIGMVCETFDPHLVSDEAREDGPILDVVREASDYLIDGFKLWYVVPMNLIGAYVNNLKKD